MSPQRELTAEMLREVVTYDPATGVFHWRARAEDSFPRKRVALAWNSRYAGKVAGGPNDEGYIKIKINHLTYAAHLLAWLYMTGEWPPHGVDHQNVNPSDNRWENLRAATGSQNSANRRRRSDNTSGLKGVSPHKDGKWRAEVTKGGKKHYLGLFDCHAAAHFAYLVESDLLHGEFARAA